MKNIEIGNIIKIISIPYSNIARSGMHYFKVTEVKIDDFLYHFAILNGYIYPEAYATKENGEKINLSLDTQRLIENEIKKIDNNKIIETI